MSYCSVYNLHVAPKGRAFCKYLSQCKEIKTESKVKQVPAPARSGALLAFAVAARPAGPHSARAGRGDRGRRGWGEEGAAPPRPAGRRRFRTRAVPRRPPGEGCPREVAQRPLRRSAVSPPPAPARGAALRPPRSETAAGAPALPARKPPRRPPGSCAVRGARGPVPGCPSGSARAGAVGARGRAEDARGPERGRRPAGGRARGWRALMDARLRAV